MQRLDVSAVPTAPGARPAAEELEEAVTTKKRREPLVTGAAPPRAIGEAVKRLRVCDAALQVLRETNNPAVMTGDSGLLHAIAERAGLPHRGWHTELRVLAALSAQPGELLPGKTLSGRGRPVRIFRLPEQAR